MNKEEQYWKKFIIFSLIHIFIMIGIIVFGESLFSNYDINSFTFVILYYIIIVSVPIILYLRFIDKQNPFIFLKLTSNVVINMCNGLAIGAFIFTIFLLFNKFKFSNELDFNKDSLFIIGTMLVGVFEEIALRGFYLQKMNLKIGFLKANILSSFIFCIMHFFSMLKYGEKILLSLLLYFVISLWLGYIFKKTQSLWTVILVHAIYNLVVYLF